MLSPDLGQVVDGVDGGVVVDERCIARTQGRAGANARAVEGYGRNIVVLNRVGVQFGQVDARLGSGEGVAGFSDEDRVVGEAPVEFVGHGGADGPGCSGGDAVAGHGIGDRGNRDIQAEDERAVWRHRGLPIVDVMAEDAELLRHIVVNPYQRFPPRRFAGKLRSIVEVGNLRGVRQGE